LVGFAGQWSGSGTIRCGGELACIISGKFLKAEYNQVNEEVLDAMGEIANMILGNFKDDAAFKFGSHRSEHPDRNPRKQFQNQELEWPELDHRSF